MYANNVVLLIPLVNEFKCTMYTKETDTYTHVYTPEQVTYTYVYWEVLLTKDTVPPPVITGFVLWKICLLATSIPNHSKMKTLNSGYTYIHTSIYILRTYIDEL